MDSILSLSLNANANLSLSFSLSLLPILLLATPGPVSPLHTHLALTGTGTGISADVNPGSASGSYLPLSLSDCISILTLCLGLQTPLDPSALNRGEYPACAALTTGYIFRVENAATVAFLQKMTRTGCLTRLEVSSGSGSGSGSSSSSSGFRGGRRRRRLSSTMACLPTVALLLVSWPGLSLDAFSAAFPFLLSISLLLLSRLFATISFRARTRRPSWHGAPEPGVTGDLLVLLSEDRWARMTGLVDDLKAVTSGRWLARRPRNPRVMDCLDWISGMMVWVVVVVLGGASEREKGMLVGAVLLGHLILVYENARAGELVMNGRTVCVAEAPDAVKRYGRRLELAEELIKEVGRSDFAVRLGMINPEQVKDIGKDDGDETRNEVVTM